MGSASDYDIMSAAIKVLEDFGVEYEKKVISAHRTPDLMCEYAKSAKERGIGAIIAGAGGAAHVAGVVAAMTTVPVIGVPIQTKALGGMDSLLSIVQMPGGIPVATMAINGGPRTQACSQCRFWRLRTRLWRKNSRLSEKSRRRRCSIRKFKQHPPSIARYEKLPHFRREIS